MDVREPIPGCRDWVHSTQTKLHQWAQTNKDEALREAWGLVTHPMVLAEAWRRLSQNQGSKTAGVDGETRASVESKGVGKLLEQVRSDLRSGRFKPVPVREHRIPKPGKRNQYRRLGIPTLRDRLVQMALKLVLEPIFEADFQSCSYGFRPGRSTHDALAEIRLFGNHPSNYEYAIEGDIRSCFDRIDHALLMRRLRCRIADRKVLHLVHAFLRAGILSRKGFEPTLEGTPQGGVLSPLLSNVLLDGLDVAYMTRHHNLSAHQRHDVRRRGGYTCYLVRYADDFVVLVKGTREQAEMERTWLAGFLRETLHLELHPEKTHVTRLTEGVDFLGFTLRRVPYRGHYVVFQYPRKSALKRVMDRVRELTRRTVTYLAFEQVCHGLNRVLRGWSAYFRYGDKKTLSYLGWLVWHRVQRWLRAKHKGRSWKWVRDRYGGPHWHTKEVALFRVGYVSVRRWRYRGRRIPSPWGEST